MSAVSTWSEQLETSLCVRIVSQRAVAGGDINQAWEVLLSDGRRVFVKENKHSPPRMFEAEALGLEFLRAGCSEESALVIPEVIHLGEGFLVLEWLERADGSSGSLQAETGQAERLGRGLAQLHKAPGLKLFGANTSNFIGTLSQSNSESSSWVEFFRTERLEAQLSLPGAKRCLGRAAMQRFETLLEDLEARLGPQGAPSRLHGDLWGGNSFESARGPAIFDPAVYAGHREVDLAMMKLFGGFSERVFAAYQEAAPLEAGWRERIEIYQLYPLLVHVNLFGGNYAASVEDALRRLT